MYDNPGMISLAAGAVGSIVLHLGQQLLQNGATFMDVDSLDSPTHLVRREWIGLLALVLRRRDPVQGEEATPPSGTIQEKRVRRSSW
jgi:hypothetical protein